MRLRWGDSAGQCEQTWESTEYLEILRQKQWSQRGRGAVRWGAHHLQLELLGSWDAIHGRRVRLDLREEATVYIVSVFERHVFCGTAGLWDKCFCGSR